MLLLCAVIDFDIYNIETSDSITVKAGIYCKFLCMFVCV